MARLHGPKQDPKPWHRAVGMRAPGLCGVAEGTQLRLVLARGGSGPQTKATQQAMSSISEAPARPRLHGGRGWLLSRKCVWGRPEWRVEPWGAGGRIPPGGHRHTFVFFLCKLYISFHGHSEQSLPASRRFHGYCRLGTAWLGVKSKPVRR